MIAEPNAMNSDSPPSYWAATATPVTEFRQLKGDIKAEVCVIGGGYLGLSSALHLAESGLKVALLDKEDVGWGASGRNGGQIIPGLKLERAKLIKKLGTERGKHLFKWAGTVVDETLALIEKYKINCQASQPGWIRPAHSHKTLQNFEKSAREWNSVSNADVRVIDREETQYKLGTDWYVGALYDPRGGRLHPLSYACGLANAATDLGARIFSKTTALSVEGSEDNWTVFTEHGNIRANQLVICTNAYTGSKAPLIPNLAKSIMPMPSYMAATAPLPDNLRERIFPDGETAADAKRLLNHFRLEPDGRFLFGGRGDVVENDHPSSFRHLLAKMVELFPDLSKQAIDYRWNGRVAMTTDHVPHLHHPAPGIWVATGCNGRGVGYCTSMGKLMSKLVKGMPAEESPMPVSQIRRIPFHSLHTTGFRIAIWFKNKQDNAERQSN